MAVRMRRARRSSNDLRPLLQASPFAIVELDRGGNVREWSPAAERLLGWTADEVLGRPLPRAILGAELDLSALLPRLAAATTTPTVQLACRHRLGRQVLAEFSPAPVYDRRGRVRGVIGLLVDITARAQLERKLRYQAQHDSLTNLPNRDLLLTRLAEVLSAGAQTGARTGLLVIDLDRFKEVNDTLGHAVGDQLLAQIGPRLLSGTVRTQDLVARLSGDEFAVVLPDIEDTAAVVAVAERVLSALHSPFTLGSVRADIAASIGVALAPDHAEDPAELLRHADTAMYEAKDTAAGVSVFQPHRGDRAPTRFGLLGELRRALDNDELVVYYQPKVDISTDAACGVEALVRWQHPDRGLLPPGEFVPVIETTALMHRLTEYVLDAALDQASAWSDQGHRIPVSVNLSARGLHDQALPARVLSALGRHGVPASLLRLEITETAVMHDPDSSLSVLTELAHAGIGLSLDDFGTGYSSMTYLQRLPVTELKVDRSFVTGLTARRADSVLVRSAIDLAHNLGMLVVAEGVEDSETLTELRELGCDIAQGYHLARPMPADKLSAWLAEQTRPPRPEVLTTAR